MERLELYRGEHSQRPVEAPVVVSVDPANPTHTRSALEKAALESQSWHAGSISSVQYRRGSKLTFGMRFSC